MMGRTADCGVVSVTVTVADPALKADTPIGFRTQAPVCRTRQRRCGGNARPCRQPGVDTGRHADRRCGTGAG